MMLLLENKVGMPSGVALPESLSLCFSNRSCVLDRNPFSGGELRFMKAYPPPCRKDTFPQRTVDFEH
jgi:hypothetical protein